MSPYADTSFLASLFLKDANSEKAIAWLRGNSRPLGLTEFQSHELNNAIRLAAFRKYVTIESAETALLDIGHHFATGNLEVTPINWHATYALADKISAAHTPTLGVRSLDLLHVASAVGLGRQSFITFDHRQSTLAHACHLTLLTP